MAGIRGVLFDAGGVLTRPRGGRWNPRYDFEEIVLRHHPGVGTDRFGAAFAAGQRFLDAGTTTADRAAYHRAMLHVLGVERPSAALLDDLDAPAAGPVLEAFPDAPPVLEHLRAAGVRMAVVSDTWAGLDRLFAEIGLDGYFEAFVISEVIGCRKPDPRMYAAGSGALGLCPAECAFIDDDPALVAAADRLGYHGVALLRDGAEAAGVRSLASLDDLPALLAAR